MNGNYILSAVVPYARGLLSEHRTALHEAWQDKDRGASAVELAVITAIILGIAVALLAIIGAFVSKEQNKIQSTNG
jgi:Flp pilus assembly pilin Flp